MRWAKSQTKSIATIELIAGNSTQQMPRRFGMRTQELPNRKGDAEGSTNNVTTWSHILWESAENHTKAAKRFINSAEKANAINGKFETAKCLFGSSKVYSDGRKWVFKDFGLDQCEQEVKMRRNVICFFFFFLRNSRNHQFNCQRNNNYESRIFTNSTNISCKLNIDFWVIWIAIIRYEKMNNAKMLNVLFEVLRLGSRAQTDKIIHHVFHVFIH